MKRFFLSGERSYAREVRTCLQRLWFVPLVAIACSLPVAAQTSMSTVRGSVTDQSGAVVPGAQVKLKDVTTNIVVRTVVTDAQGNYEIDDVIGGQ
jgi:Carboxypeptidase regulatory-like domain